MLFVRRASFLYLWRHIQQGKANSYPCARRNQLIEKLHKNAFQTLAEMIRESGDQLKPCKLGGGE